MKRLPKKFKIEVRCTEAEKARIILLAQVWANGSISEYVLNQCLRAPRKTKGLGKTKAL